MYPYCDQSVFDMPRGERLLLWAMRAWVAAVERGSCPFRLLLPVFQPMGIATTAIPFHKAMSLLQLGGASCPPTVGLGDDHVHEPEAVLLALWTQLDQPAAALRTLELLVDADQVVAVFTAMTATRHCLHHGRPDLFPAIPAPVRPVRPAAISPQKTPPAHPAHPAAAHAPHIGRA